MLVVGILLSTVLLVLSKSAVDCPVGAGRTKLNSVGITRQSYTIVPVRYPSQADKIVILAVHCMHATFRPLCTLIVSCLRVALSQAATHISIPALKPLQTHSIFPSASCPIPSCADEIFIPALKPALVYCYCTVCNCLLAQFVGSLISCDVRELGIWIRR